MINTDLDNSTVKTTFAPGVALPTAAPAKAEAAKPKVPAKAKPAPKAAAKPATKPVKSLAKPAAKAVTPATVAPQPVVKAVAKKAVTKVAVAPKTPKTPKAPKPEKLPKAKKAKMVRDSMTMPQAEYAVLDELKLRAAKLASPVKKTELLRAGIKALAAMTDASFLAALKAVPSLKTGRPSKN